MSRELRRLQEALEATARSLTESMRLLAACNEKAANACLHACIAVKTANELNVRSAEAQSRVIELERKSAVSELLEHLEDEGKSLNATGKRKK